MDVHPTHRELAGGVDTHRRSVYGSLAVDRARAWGSDDLPSVAAASSTMMYMTGAVPEHVGDVVIRRSMLPQSTYIDRDRGLVYNNPGATARVDDGSDPVPATRQVLNLRKREYEDITRLDASLKFGSGGVTRDLNGRAVGCLPHGGLNGIVSDVRDTSENTYHDPGNIVIESSLSDVLRLGGRIHRDVGAVSHASVVIEMPKDVGLPFRIMPEVVNERAAASEPFDEALLRSPFDVDPAD